MQTGNLLQSTKGRLAAFGLLYISEGIPYGFSTTAMVAFMRTEGLSLGQIGAFVAALFIPWSFKWAWAPVVDIVKLHRFGGRKAWIFFCTSMMIVTLLITAAVDFVENFKVLLAAIVLNNFFCATQDVAIDSLAVSTLEEHERGRGNGFMFAGQYLGIAMGGGGAIFVFGLWGFDVALLYVSALLVLELLFVFLFIQDPEANRSHRINIQNPLRELMQTVKAFVKELYSSFMKSGPGPKIGLVFSVTPIGAMALAYAILGTMNVDKGLNELQIAEISVYNTIASAIGCLLGGLLGDRLGIKKMVALFYCLTTLPTLYLAFQISSLGLTAVPIGAYYAVVICFGLFFGMAFGQRAAIFMGMTNPAVAASQFTAFMAMSNLIISITNYWQGIIAERFDYALVLYLDAAFVIVSLLFIPFLRNREEQPDALNSVRSSMRLQEEQ